MTYQQPYDPHQRYRHGRAPVPYVNDLSTPPPDPALPPPAGFLRRLGPGQRAAAYLGAGLLGFTLLCCGGSAVLGAIAPETQEPPATAEAVGSAEAPAAGVPAPSSPAAAATSAVPTPSAGAIPVVRTRTVTEIEKIPFTERRVNDPTLAEGTTKVEVKGVAGVKTRTYEVTYTDGEQTGKRLISEQVTKDPVTKVIMVGTKVSQECDPHYSGPCVPIASDVDCAGGSGNGPAYVRGPVYVTGDDIYDLDRDGDGVACEK